jgi:NAD(P)-dependent dehydrogenase (short-subunit alcohol dehydrogenase family)
MESIAVPTDLFSVSGKSIVVTGATGALGAPAARALAAGGARLTAAGQNAAALADLVRDVQESGGTAQAVTRRASTPENAAEIVAAAVAAYGGLDLLLVASGLNKTGPAVDADVGDWDSVIDANVKEPWLICQAAGRQMIRQKRGGKIVLISSTRAKLGAPGFGPYCSSKAALNGMVRALAAEWGVHGITVNAVAPTLFRSPLTEWLFDERGAAVRESILRRIPLGRLAEPGDFVGPVLFMLSAAADFCTGQILYIDGGLTAA